MSKGFVFDYNKCVACNACNVACILENGWSVHPRKIYTYNDESSHLLPPLNLSLACNHCEIPVCLNSCPTASYYRDTLTNAVIIEDEKCIGCRYCQWNCPYDAPKFNDEKGIIEKCNLCCSLLIEGGVPACSNSCPTGALKFEEISQSSKGNFPVWFPDKKLIPAIRLLSIKERFPFKIVPGNRFPPENPVLFNKEGGTDGKLSLIAFSFLTTIAVSIVTSALIKGIFPSGLLYIPIIILAGLISLFHLEQPLKAWKAVTNLKNSPLSREILFFSIFSCLSIISVLFKFPEFFIFSSIIGLVLLITIDAVYIYADSRNRVLLHSGQTFLSSLLITSFMSGSIFPFIFIAVLKLAASMYNFLVNRKYGISFGIRFLRIALLILTGVSLVLNISYSDYILISLFLTGEFLDRLIYYYDFDPININTLTNEQ
jgi:Fe-S-cluster-containing dehydrogenase component/DMSO reductase anchor subunit